jgi:hypothetical protein
VSATATARQSTHNQITGESLPGYWSRAELAARLQKSERTLDRMHLQRTGPPRIALGSGSMRKTVVLYKIEAVEAWLDSLAVGPGRACRVSRRRSA